MTGAGDTQSRTVRPRLALALLGLSFLSTVLSGAVVYTSMVVRHEGRFVDLAGRVIDEPAVRDALADEIVEVAFTAIAADELVVDVLPAEARQLATPVTRLATAQLAGAAFDALDRDVAVRARDAALRELHRQLVHSDSSTVTIDLRALVVRVARELGGPPVASAVAAVASTQDIGRYEIARDGSGTGTIVAVLRLLPDIGFLAIAITVTLSVLAVVVAIDRRQALTRVGLCIAAGALTSTVVGSLALSTLLNFGDDGAIGDLGGALAGAINSDFAARQRGAMLTGLTIALIGWASGRSRAALAVRNLPRHVWKRDGRAFASSVATVLGDNPALARLLVWTIGAVTLLSWPTPTLRVLVSIPIVTVGAQIAVWLATSGHPRATHWRHGTSIDTGTPADEEGGRLVTPTGASLVVLVAMVLLVWPSWSRHLVLGSLVIVGLLLAATEVPGAVRHARRGRVSGAAEPPAPRRTPVRLVGAAVALVTAVVAGVAVSTASGAGNGQSAADGCNGHVELCGRRIDQVTFAGSHNSMSSRDLGWDLAMQQGDIVAQLDSGIRALLVDTHYWDRRGTVEGGDDPTARYVIEAALADDRPRPGLWLCHGFCALGASSLDGVLAEIDSWLDENPHEVLLMIIQDETSAADTMDAFERSGLIDHVHTHVPSTPWPTLGALIEADERLLVFAENEGEPDSWYQNVYDSAFTETPYTFAVRTDFSCEPNRGADENPLFLVNHWITSGIPVVEAARAVNSAESLMARIEECRVERGRDPNVLAVDFAQVGDLVAVVDELNASPR